MTYNGSRIQHIDICIPTYKRPYTLRRLLSLLQNLRTEMHYTYSIIVVDNDVNQSARTVVSAAQKESPIQIDYCVEPVPNVALARNCAINHAKGDFVAFIDDDEYPSPEWLLNLYLTCIKYSADGVLGQVLADFQVSPPRWIVGSNILNRETYPTGQVMRWDQTRTGNVLINRNIFKSPEAMFNPAFKHGEDKDFFRRMISLRKYVFVWCNDAPVYEIYPRERLRRCFFIKRAILRGGVSLIHSNYSLRAILLSMIATGVYTLSLPVLFFWGQGVFMRYLVKDCDHIGKLLMACRIDLREYLIRSTS